MTLALELLDTVPAGMLRHRLALGLELVDACRQAGAMAPLCIDVEKIGKRPFPRVVGGDRFPMRFAAHRADRHAMRYDGRARRLVDAMAQDVAANPGAEKGWIVRIHGPRDALSQRGMPDGDARLYVPRRLRLEIALQDGAPSLTVGNLRRPWLWPASAYPVDDTATVVRGRVLRGASVDTAKPVRWARVFLTSKRSPGAFDASTIVGCGHGDDRGDFVIALGRSKQTSGATLPRAADVALWAFAPPAVAPDPNDWLADLPVENMGAAPAADALRGDLVAATYTQFAVNNISVPLGATKSDADTTLIKP